MRRLYSSREFALMLAELRTKPPATDETMEQLRKRLGAAVHDGMGRSRFQRYQLPECRVVRSVLASAGVQMPTQTEVLK